MLHRSAVVKAVEALRADPASAEAAIALHELALGADGADAELVEDRLALVAARRARTGCHLQNNLTMPRCPDVVVRPTSESEIRAALARDRFKAIGGGWGFSGAAHTTGAALVLGEHTSGVEPIPPAELRPEVDASYLCRFGAGTTIAQLDAALAARHRALVNAPGFERLTFVGTAAVGGNGSGAWLGPLSEQIRSIDLVHVDAAGDVQRLRVEPETTPPPITDAARFGGAVVFDDALFAACKVGLGLLGVIVSVTIDVVPDFFLVERRERHAWATVVAELPQWLAAQGPRDSGKPYHSVELWLNPYRKKASCVVGTRAWTPLKTRLGERPHALRASSAATFRFISAVMRALPGAVPTLLNASLALSAHGDVRMPSWQALGFGAPNLAEVHPAAVALDASDPAALIAQLTTIRAWLRAEYDARRYVSSPIGLRFVGASHAPLSPHRGRTSCLVELPLLVGTPHWERLIEGFHRLAATLGGRPHWGQLHDVDAAGLTAAYGAAAASAFARARARLDPLGRCDNALAARLGLTTAPAPAGLMMAAAATRHAPTPGVGQRRSWSRLFVDPSPAPTVVSPGGDVLALVARLRAEGKRLVLNGGNGSLHTQSLSDGQRHYLDTEQCLDRQIGPITTASAPRITVGAGARWGDIVRATRTQGYLPRIVPTFRGITVGGSLAANAIGQASRHAGHELDGVLSLDAVVPGGQSQAPQRITIDPRSPGQHEGLLRALVGGYGQIGIVERATYELVPVPRDARAVTTARRFDHGDLAGALRALQPAGAGDALNKSCVLFHRKDRWYPTVLSTHFAVVPDGDHPSLLTYNDATDGTRRLAEGLLSFMPTAHLAGKLADASMKAASDDGRRYVDPIEGFLFVMDPNHAYKEGLSAAGQAVFAPTLQQTFVVPDDAAEDFIRFVQARLVLPKKALRGELRTLGARPEAEIVEAFEGGALQDAAQLERYAREAEACEDDGPRRLTALRATARASVSELALALVQRMANLPTLVPALFEMVWVPRDDQYLSATFGQSGFAVSLTFQGPGVDGGAPIVAHSRVFERLHHAIHEALASIAQRCADVGGRFNLCKNVFAPGPSEQSVAFVRGVLSQRPHSLDRFEAVRDQYNHGGFLGSRFGREVLGLP